MATCSYLFGLLDRAISEPTKNTVDFICLKELLSHLIRGGSGESVPVSLYCDNEEKRDTLDDLQQDKPLKLETRKISGNLKEKSARKAKFSDDNIEFGEQIENLPSEIDVTFENQNIPVSSQKNDNSNVLNFSDKDSMNKNNRHSDSSSYSTTDYSAANEDDNNFGENYQSEMGREESKELNEKEIKTINDSFSIDRMNEPKQKASNYYQGIIDTKKDKYMVKGTDVASPCKSELEALDRGEDFGLDNNEDIDLKPSKNLSKSSSHFLLGKSNQNSDESFTGYDEKGYSNNKVQEDLVENLESCPKTDRNSQSRRPMTGKIFESNTEENYLRQNLLISHNLKERLKDVEAEMKNSGRDRKSEINKIFGRINDLEGKIKEIIELHVKLPSNSSFYRSSADLTNSRLEINNFMPSEICINEFENKNKEFEKQASQSHKESLPLNDYSKGRRMTVTGVLEEVKISKIIEANSLSIEKDDFNASDFVNWFELGDIHQNASTHRILDKAIDSENHYETKKVLIEEVLPKIFILAEKDLIEKDSKLCDEISSTEVLNTESKGSLQLNSKLEQNVLDIQLKAESLEDGTQMYSNGNQVEPANNSPQSEAKSERNLLETFDLKLQETESKLVEKLKEIEETFYRRTNDKFNSNETNGKGEMLEIVEQQSKEIKMLSERVNDLSEKMKENLLKEEASIIERNNELLKTFDNLKNEIDKSVSKDVKTDTTRISRPYSSSYPQQTVKSKTEDCTKDIEFSESQDSGDKFMDEIDINTINQDISDIKTDMQKFSGLIQDVVSSKNVKNQMVEVILCDVLQIRERDIIK
ncbi:MAG: hypothetical protein MHMPM18_000910 [Marteilia pararefringens]